MVSKQLGNTEFGSIRRYLFDRNLVEISKLSFDPYKFLLIMVLIKRHFSKKTKIKAFVN